MSRAARICLAALLGPTALVRAADIVPADAVIDDASARLALAATHVRLRDFAAAARIYDELIASSPNPSAALLAAAGELRIYAGRPADALPFFQRALANDPANLAARRGEALSLAWTGRKDEALPRLARLAAERPDDVEIGRALAELSPSPVNSANALELARKRVEATPNDPLALADLADLEALRGHAAAARSLHARAAAQPAPAETVASLQLRRARAGILWGDFYAAEAAYRNGLVANPDDDRLRADLVGLLVAMDRFERAETACLVWIDRAPGSTAAHDALAKLRQRGSPAAAKQFTPPELLPDKAPALHALAGQAAGAGRFDFAVTCLRAARAADPDYFPARLDLAEFLAITGHYDEANRDFETLAAEFPESRQILLKQARALGWSRRYDDSLAAYERLRALNPEDRIPLLEQARVASWGKQRRHSAELYAKAWEHPVDQRLAGALAAFPAERFPLPDTRDLLEKSTERAPFEATEAFERELAQLPADQSAPLAQLRLDLHSDLLLQRAFWLENRAKQLAWDGRMPEAQHVYERLLAANPLNQEALFDLSQVQAAQGLGAEERVTLGRLLTLDANNQLAARGLFRRDRRSEPTLTATADYFRENGRGSLSSIRRSRGSLVAEFTADDRFHLHAGLLRWREDPDTRSKNYYADGFTIGADGVFNERLSGSAEYTHKDYDSLPTRVTDTGMVQGWLVAGEGLRIGLGFERREELANEWALNEGTTSDHRWIGAHWDATRRASIEAKADSIAYSDNNDGVHLNLSPAYVWSEHPRTFKTTLSLDWRDTAKDNVDVYAGPTLIDIIHPYWTPQDYFGATLILEWRHDLAREFFLGAPEHWYDIRLGLSTGNDGNSGLTLAADYAKEWDDRWIVRAGIEATTSQEWEALRARLALTRRF